jgi:hypothetical protein
LELFVDLASGMLSELLPASFRYAAEIHLLGGFLASNDERLIYRTIKIYQLRRFYLVSQSFSFARELEGPIEEFLLGLKSTLSL